MKYPVPWWLVLPTIAFAGVTLTSPANDSTVHSTVKYLASDTTSCSKGVAATGIYTAPPILAYKINRASLDTILHLAPRRYNTVVEEWEGGYAKTPITLTVKTARTGKVPSSSHVFLLVEENHKYSDVIGNAAVP